MVVTADTVKMDPQALRVVEEVFNSQIENGLHPGAALAVYRHGQLVLDLYGGVADYATGRPVTEDTLFVLYSSVKPFAAAVIYVLMDRGLISLDEPVAKYWPEFAQNGKAGVTVRHILSHRGGFPLTPPELTWDKWSDWEFVMRAVEKAPTVSEPGTVLAYHPLNYGWVCGELVRRIDGRPFNQFLREEVTGPLGMNDFYVGLPPSLEGRVAKIYAMEDVDSAGLNMVPNIPHLVDTWNRPEVHQAVIPSANGIGTARDLARFYAMMVGGGTLDGVQILKPETIKEVTQLQAQGIDANFGNFLRLCLGMALGDPSYGFSRTVDRRTYGHAGAGTSVGWGDPDSGLAFAFVPNGFRSLPMFYVRPAALSQAVRNACL